MKKPPGRNGIPLEASLSNPWVGLYHGHLKKVRIVLKVYRVTELV